MAREKRLDVLRGLALVTILIDHLPDNFWSFYTLGRFGLSDAAEGFVLISGMAAALAYGAAFRPGGRVMVGLGRVWKRAWTLYLVQILITVIALGLAVLLSRWFAMPGMMKINGVDAFFADAPSAMVRLPLLVQQLSYVDILPLYVALLLAAPAMLWLAPRQPWLLLAGSVALWAASNRWGLDLPNHPSPTGWFFNPLTWQVYFVIGILAGTALKDGRRLVPVTPWLMIPALAVLAFGLNLYLGGPGAQAVWDWRWRELQSGAPQVLYGIDKTFVPLPRLLHALALAYVLSALPLVKRLCEARVAAPFALLGRNGLTVFGLISLLNFAMQLVRVQTGIAFGTDSLMLAGGLVLIFVLAAAKEYWPRA